VNKTICEVNKVSKDCSNEAIGSSEGGEGAGRREKGITGRLVDQTEGYEISNEAGRQHYLEKHMGHLVDRAIAEWLWAVL
jgi:hypothetical protein